MKIWLRSTKILIVSTYIIFTKIIFSLHLVQDMTPYNSSLRLE